MTKLQKKYKELKDIVDKTIGDNSLFTKPEMELILQCARLSEVSYQDPESPIFKSWVAMIGRDVEIWDVRNSEGFGVVIGDNLFVVFRGTEPTELNDWMTDLKASKFPFEGFDVNTYVHYGFHRYEENLHRDIKRFVKAHPDKNVIVTGHSLGGSASNICAVKLYKDGINSTVITFGAPPVGDEAFVEEYNKILGNFTLRFEMSCDIVPRIPEMVPWLDHVGSRFYIPFFGKKLMVNPPKRNRWADIIGRRMVGIISLRPFSGVKDHGMTRYKIKLSKMFGREY